MSIWKDRILIESEDDEERKLEELKEREKEEIVLKSNQEKYLR